MEAKCQCGQLGVKLPGPSTTIAACHFHPREQAHYRKLPVDELRLFKALGLAPL